MAGLGYSSVSEQAGQVIGSQEAVRSRQYGRDILAPREPQAQAGTGAGAVRSRPSGTWWSRTSRDGSAARWSRSRTGHGDAGGPVRQAPGVPAARPVPARRQAGHAGATGPQGGAARARRAAHRVRVRRRARSSAPRSPRRAGSTSRASTTPSWWRRSGATTCATSASWSSTWRAWTTCPPSSATSSRATARRLGVLVDHLVAGSKESRIAAAVGGRPQRARRRPPVHRHLGGGQAGPARPAGLARRAPGAVVEGRRAGADRLAARDAAGRRGRLAPDPAVRSAATPTWSRSCSAGSRSSSTS